MKLIPPKLDLTGKRFGLWLVMELAQRTTPPPTYHWRCICECGTERVFEAWRLEAGEERDCGCVKAAKEAAKQKPARKPKAEPKPKREVLTLTFAGQTLTASEWATRTGISADALRNRLRDGWGVEQALSTPMRPRAKQAKQAE